MIFPDILQRYYMTIPSHQFDFHIIGEEKFGVHIIMRTVWCALTQERKKQNITHTLQRKGKLTMKMVKRQFTLMVRSSSTNVLQLLGW